MQNQYSRDIYLEYRKELEKALNNYDYLMNTQRLVEIQILSALIWRVGLLAETWGIIASKLSSDGTDYLQRWQSGE